MILKLIKILLLALLPLSLSAKTIIENAEDGTVSKWRVVIGDSKDITRDLDEDIRDFEPNNRLLKVNLFQVTESGKVKEIKMLSSVDTNFSKKDESSNIDINSSSSNSNIHISIPKDSSDSVGGVEIFYSFLLLYISLITYFLFRKEYINL